MSSPIYFLQIECIKFSSSCQSLLWNDVKTAWSMEKKNTMVNQPVMGVIQNARTWNSYTLSTSRMGLPHDSPPQARIRKVDRPMNLMVVKPSTEG